MRPYPALKPWLVLECKILFQGNMRRAMRRWFRAEKKQARQYLKRQIRADLST